MKKMRILAMLLALLCIASLLGGCGGNKESTSEIDGIKLSGVNEFPIVDQKVEFNIFATKSANFTGHEDNEFTKWYEEKTGVHMNWIEPSGDAQQTFNLMIASGEYPDLILGMGLSREQVTSLVSQGILVDIKDEIEEHGYYIKKMFEEEPSAEEYVTINGAIYGVPKVNAEYSSKVTNGAWVYEPWLKKLGIEMPQTTDDFYQMLKAFKEKDPNGNGIADEIPFCGRGMSKAYTAGTEPYLMSAFIPTDGRARWYLDDGKIKYTAVQPEYREGLRFFRKLYKEGLLYQDTFIIDRTQLTSIGESKTPILGVGTGSYQGYFCTPGGQTERYHEFVSLPPLEGPNGVRKTLGSNSVTGGHSFMVTKECKYPDIAVKWVDWLLSFEGKQKSQYNGLSYKRPAKEGELGLDGQQALWAVEKESEEQRAKYGNGQPHNISWQKSGIWYNSFEESVRTYDPNNKDSSAYKFYEQYIPYAVYNPSITIAEEDVDEYTDYQLITDEVDSFFAKFVTGELDIDNDKDWATYTERLEGLGLTNYMALLQRNYDRDYK